MHWPANSSVGTPQERKRVGLAESAPKRHWSNSLTWTPIPAEEGLERWEVEHGNDTRDRPWVLEEDRDPVVDGEGERLG